MLYTAQLWPARMQDINEVFSDHGPLANAVDAFRVREGQIEPKVVKQAIADLGINPDKPNPAVS